MDYEEKARLECSLWEQDILTPSSKFSQLAKKWQTTINNKIPQKVHDTITAGIKHMVKTVLIGSKWMTTESPLDRSISLEEREMILSKKQRNFARIASVEGAGTGAGGLLMGLADFPLLLSIKIKFLYEAARLYGYDIKDPSERLFILYVFQLAFSSDDKRRNTFSILKNWETDHPNPETFDWQTFQQEYRDSMDLAKLLQLVPGIGAVVGAVVNYRLLDQLALTAKNVYRLRYFQLEEKDQNG
ncbi:EcsC family protein [Pullulanibacillus sp. KACC 23026]|uniref:EcsC family protein n=1 Tax=Pullulanibacillus sp. KACC 23026 TaxID=3028315 RepID=UPI0023B11879|nr:EcsC family protein [Pullulanibacillus sp. KACC 23026]WEG10832.1 EcsC family protein [Pullulanibacillus sp. KACC 23026]